MDQNTSGEQRLFAEGKQTDFPLHQNDRPTLLALALEDRPKNQDAPLLETRVAEQKAFIKAWPKIEPGVGGISCLRDQAIVRPFNLSSLMVRVQILLAAGVSRANVCTWRRDYAHG